MDHCRWDRLSYASNVSIRKQAFPPLPTWTPHMCRDRWDVEMCGFPLQAETPDQRTGYVAQGHIDVPFTQDREREHRAL